MTRRCLQFVNSTSAWPAICWAQRRRQGAVVFEQTKGHRIPERSTAEVATQWPRNEANVTFANPTKWSQRHRATDPTTRRRPPQGNNPIPMRQSILTGLSRHRQLIQQVITSIFFSFLEFVHLTCGGAHYQKIASSPHLNRNRFQPCICTYPLPTMSNPFHRCSFPPPSVPDISRTSEHGHLLIFNRSRSSSQYPLNSSSCLNSIVISSEGTCTS